SQEGQITSRFNDAIAHLADKENLPKRLGGILALERIARDSPRDHWPVMEILTAYVRENAHWNPDRPEVHPFPIDIQAVMRALGRRARHYETADQRLDLRGVDLRWADLTGMHLERADFGMARMENARLSEAYVDGASFSGACLKDASLLRASAENADFSGADM